jgi:hypothetical protein
MGFAAAKLSGEAWAVIVSFAASGCTGGGLAAAGAGLGSAAGGCGRAGAAGGGCSRLQENDVKLKPARIAVKRMRWADIRPNHSKIG